MKSSHLFNALASSTQLEASSSQLDGVPKDLEDAIRFETAKCIQSAGVLLHLSQEPIAQAIVLLQRYWTSPDGGSMLETDPVDAAAAALYLTVKSHGVAISPRQLLTVFEYIRVTPDQQASSAAESRGILSQGQYELNRDRLYAVESDMCRVLGFQTQVALPYALCINYLQALDVMKSSRGHKVARRAFNYLNAALLSSQLLYLTHQPSELATAAIYLAARELGVSMPDVEWWEVFDVDREDLGFLVVGMQSVVKFAEAEKKRWSNSRAPLTVDELVQTLQQRRTT